MGWDIVLARTACEYFRVCCVCYLSLPSRFSYASADACTVKMDGYLRDLTASEWAVRADITQRYSLIILHDCPQHFVVIYVCPIALYNRRPMSLM